MIDVMMRLGEFGFGLDTASYDRLSKKHAWRWAKQARIGRKPAYQSIGPDSTTITLKGTIYPHWRAGLGQIERLREMADDMEPYLLVDGRGISWGHFVILSLSEDQSHITAKGSPKQQQFTLELAEYGEDNTDA